MTFGRQVRFQKGSVDITPERAAALYCSQDEQAKCLQTSVCRSPPLLAAKAHRIHSCHAL